MADIRRIEIVIDRDADLAPQVALYRAQGVPWSFLERLSGRKRNRLEERIARWRRELAERRQSPPLTL